MIRKSNKNSISSIILKTRYGVFKISRKSFVILCVIILILIVGIASLVVKGGTLLFEGILGGRDPVKTEEQLQSELQQLVEDSMFRIKVNERPSMDADTGVTSIIVQNSVENPFNKKVKYYTLDGIDIYETRVLYPGDDLLSAQWDLDWEPGEYELMADVIAIDPYSEEEFIVSTLEIILRIK